MKLGQIGNIKPPRFASQKSCLKRIWRSPAVPLFHTSFLRQRHRCLWISTLLNKHLESSRYSVIVVCLSETAANTWEWSLGSFKYWNSVDSMTVVLSPESPEEEMKTLPEGSNCGRAISMTCHQRFDRHHKVSQVAWQKAEFLEFLEFHKIWVLHQNEDDYTAGCHVLNKGTSNAATGKRFQCFSCVSACVISICLSALVFVLQKFGAENIVLHPAIAKGNRFQPLPSARPKASCPHGSLASVLPACLTPIRYQRLNVKCTASVCLASATLLYNFTPSRAKGKPSI